MLKDWGWINGETIKFDFSKQDKKYKIPHIGWNNIDIKKESPLLRGVKNDHLFYFVYSYHLVCSDKKDVLSETEYGITFTSAIQKDNIYGTQFHPEKSYD